MARLSAASRPTSPGNNQSPTNVCSKPSCETSARARFQFVTVGAAKNIYVCWSCFKTVMLGEGACSRLFMDRIQGCGHKQDVGICYRQ